MINSKVEPYRVLFSLGLITAGLAVALWLLFSLQLIGFYPKQAHANLMFMGFIWAFIAGFLMTGVPKMLRADSASFFEKRFAELTVITQIVLAFTNQINLAVFVFLIQGVFLLIFLARRFLPKRTLPFEGFIFIPFAFIAFFFGIHAFYFAGGDFQKLFEYSGQAFILNLICGIGSRLIPVLSRVPNAISPDQSTEVVSSFGKSFAMAAILNACFYLPLIGLEQEAFLAKGVVLFFHIIIFFKIFTPPTSKSYLAYSLKLASLAIPLGYLAAYFFPDLTLPMMHITYIGGIALVTVLVATRVTLAHGGASLDAELNSKAIIWTAAVVLVSMVARVFAQYAVTGGALWVSAICFLIALLLWSVRFGKILVRGN